VGAHYRDFHQVDDAEVVAAMRHAVQVDDDRSEP
jgi:predicted phosphoribosyltransferase